jgi:ribosomal-protein-alanine N-acetyltransferase
MNLAVLAPFRRRRCGESNSCVRRLRAGVRAWGESGDVGSAGVESGGPLTLYERLGFRQTARSRARYYVKPDEDAVLMELAPLEVRCFV